MIFLNNYRPNCWGGSGIFFLHNWRCAGSSMSSLMAANFGSFYIKVGHPFTNYGWPESYRGSTKQITSLDEIRGRIQPGCIVGGHLFTGFESLLPGRWDLWMNARHPVERLISGLLRFHSNKVIPNNPQADLHTGHEALYSPTDVSRILNGPLRREINGMSRRLAGFTAIDSISVSAQGNLEKADFLERTVDHARLMACAKSQLSELKILIMAHSFQASVLCIEAAYSLEPLINPFSDLRHNSAQLSKPSQAQRTMLQRLRPKFEELMKADITLWNQLEILFKYQIDSYNIQEDDIKIRELIHREPLLDPTWLTDPAVTPDLLLKGFAGRIAQRAVLAGELGPKLIDTVCRWPRLDPSASKEIRNIAMRGYTSRHQRIATRPSL